MDRSKVSTNKVKSSGHIESIVYYYYMINLLVRTIEIVPFISFDLFCISVYVSQGSKTHPWWIWKQKQPITTEGRKKKCKVFSRPGYPFIGNQI